jgi:hypothetical protein
LSEIVFLQYSHSFLGRFLPTQDRNGQFLKDFNKNNKNNNRKTYMLIQAPLKQNDIVTLKLLTGEEVIANFESEVDGDVTISKPLVIAANAEGMGLIPWVMSSMPSSIPISKESIIAFMPTAADVAKQYAEITSSIKLV